MAAIATLAISGGVAAYGAYQQSQASKKAATQQQQAAERALALQKSQYDAAQSQLAPYTGVGAEAVGKLRTMADNPPTLELPEFRYQEFGAPSQADMVADPAYQLRQREDQRAIQQSAAARGGGLSGNTLTALSDRSQALASEEYANTYNRALASHQQNASQAYQQYLSRYNQATGQYQAGQEPWNRWSRLLDFGAGATDRNINVGQNYANQAGGLYTDIGNAQAGATMGSANAWSQGMNSATADWSQAATLAYEKYLQSKTKTPAPTTTATAPAYGTFGYGYGSAPWYQQPKQQKNPWDVEW